MKLVVGQYYYLANDAVSNFKDKRGKPIVYAHAGDRVLLKSDIGNVVILESVHGVKFPTETKNIVEINNLFTP